MTHQTEQPIVHRSLSAANRSSREVARMIAEDGDLSPAYQRGSVWTVEQRIGLIRSWLLGMPIPAVIINDRFTGVWPQTEDGFPVGGHLYAVIDGKQRIETAIAWYDDQLKVPASWFTADDVEMIVETEDGPYTWFGGLSRAARRLFVNRSLLPVIEISVGTIREEAELYLLVNGAGTQQSADDLANAEEVAGR